MQVRAEAQQKGGRPVKFAHSRNPAQNSLLGDEWHAQPAPPAAAPKPEPTVLLGHTANATDSARLSGQRAQVEAIMLDGAWHTLPGLVKMLRLRFGSLYAETSVSARLREMRGKGFRVDRQRSRPGSGLYQYRAIKESHVENVQTPPDADGVSLAPVATGVDQKVA